MTENAKGTLHADTVPMRDTQLKNMCWFVMNIKTLMRTSNCWRFISKGVSTSNKLICCPFLEISDYLSMPVVIRAVIVQLNFQNPMKISLIFILQTISIDKQQYTIFYDSGCNEMICRYDAVQRIGSRAKQEMSGPLKLSGVGNCQSICEHGAYRVNLSLYNGKDRFSGICLDVIT